MRSRKDIAWDIRGAIKSQDRFHYLRNDEHQKLLREACELLLRQTVGGIGLCPKTPTLLVGPETMGAHMLQVLSSATVPFETLHTAALVKERSGEYHWSSGTAPKVSDGMQMIWVDDSLRVGKTIRESAPLLQQLKTRISAVAVLADFAYLRSRTIVPAGIITYIERRTSE